MRTLIEYGLANAAAATALAVVALLVGLVVRRPAVRNALWVLVFVRLLVPPVWTVPVPVPAAGSEPEVPVIVATVPEPVPPAPDVAEPDPAFDDGVGQLAAGEPAEGPTPAGPEPVPAVAPGAVAGAPAPAGFRLPAEAFTVLAGVWLAGSAFVFARAARRIARFRRALRDARPAPAAVQEQAAELARAMGLRRCPAVLVVPGRVWPALWMPGLFARQARLLLPAGLLPILDPGQRAAVLAHELSHLRRGDPWVRWLELAACGLYWWHPLLGWFRRQLRESEEECCDLWVVAARCGRKEYATALVETAAYLSHAGPPRAPAPASGAGPVKDLERRVTMIMRATWPARLTRLGLAAVLGIGGLGLAFGPALAQDRKDPGPKDRDRPAKERPDDRDRERDRDRDRADRDRDRERGPADREDVAKAREAVEKARAEAREAMERWRQAEEKLARAEGRPVVPPARGNFPGFGPSGRGPGAEPGRPGGPPGVGPRGNAPAPPDLPRRPGAEGPRGPGGELREMQQQINELRRLVEEMRREMRRGDRRDPERPREGRSERGTPPRAGGAGASGYPEFPPGPPAAPGYPRFPGADNVPDGPGSPPAPPPLPRNEGRRVR